MTNNLRDEIARREKICEAATPGRPQALWANAGGHDECKHGYDKAFECPYCVESFAAHARTGYPEVLAALADAVAALEKLSLPDAPYGDVPREAQDARAALAQIAGRLGGGE